MTETGNLVIGAEGAHSVVREYLFGKEKSKLEGTPIVATLAVARLSAEAIARYQNYGSRMMLMFHPSGYFSWIGSKYGQARRPRSIVDKF